VDDKLLPPGLYLGDCMDYMKQFPDKYFDLAVVDPPYGSGNETGNNVAKFAGGPLWSAVRQVQAPDSSASIRVRDGTGTIQGGVCRTGGTWAERYGKKIVAWDVAPGKEYFDELFRVSRNQIIWGGNYFNLPPTRCFLVWKKLTISESFTMAMCEYAWTSFDGNAKLFECAPQGNAQEQRYHPTQKPVRLYSWILDRYAKPGMRILDTHAGSASSLVACHRAGLDCWGFEIDPVYYEKSKRRLEKECAQVTMMDVIKQADNAQITMTDVMKESV